MALLIFVILLIGWKVVFSRPINASNPANSEILERILRNHGIVKDSFMNDSLVLPSFPVAVVGDISISKLFEDEWDQLSPLVKKYQSLKYLDLSPAERGIPPSNWIKFDDDDGNILGIFMYKTIHRCLHLMRTTSGSKWIFDILDASNLQFSDRKLSPLKNSKVSFLSKATVGYSMVVHSVTTPLNDVFSVTRMKNLTSFLKSESDYRILRIPPSCRATIKSKMQLLDLEPYYVLTGSFLKHFSSVRELQFVAIVDSSFVPLSWWPLADDSQNFSANANANSQQSFLSRRTQKNWLAFVDSTSCELLLSKYLAPYHDVVHFQSWTIPSGEIVFPKRIASTWSLSKDSNNSNNPNNNYNIDYNHNHRSLSSLATTKQPNMASWRPSSRFILRGSAPVVSHPSLLSTHLAIGCAHLRGKQRVYRHVFYIMETIMPYRILAWSKLFVFQPYRSIEFVSSLLVMKNGNLQLSYGSSDCEPRLGIITLQSLRNEFQEFFLED